MAEKVDNFVFHPSHKYRKHDWDRYLDGSIWRLTRGEDFANPVASFRSQAFVAAGRRDLTLRTHADGDILVLQAVPKIHRLTG